MGTKERFYNSENSGIVGYQELSFDYENVNPVCVEIENPSNF